MNNKIALFACAAKRFAQNKAAIRKLYTDQIYPYPHDYINTKVHPSFYRYRETFGESPWQANDQKIAWYLWRFFWATWWYQLFNDPGAVLGHYSLPDPDQFTDAELGIPPDEYGTYYEWLERTGAGQ